MSGFYDKNDDIEQDGMVNKTVVGAICTASFVFLIFLICLYQGTKKTTSNNTSQSANSDASIYANNDIDDDDELVIGKNNFKSRDLDFWDMFGSGSDRDISEPIDESEGKPAVFSEQGVKPDITSGETDSNDSNWENGNPQDNTHIAITDSTGKKTWYEILNIAKSSYTPNNLKVMPSGMLQYVDGDMKSAFGADVNSDSGAVDMTTVKNSGVTYVMIRAHKRDSSTGFISMDPLFNINAVNAAKEGLKIGITVDSQALTETEAIEEANYAIATANSVKPQYPVAINVPDLNDECRISKLTNDQRTKNIKAFCDQVRNYGFKPLIHATKNDLITKINIEDLAAYDIWVTDIDSDSTSTTTYFTDYPYTYTMWQYARGINLCGINGAANLDASFVNYEQN